jgi:hypothetical protein
MAREVRDGNVISAVGCGDGDGEPEMTKDPDCMFKQREKMWFHEE